MSDVVVVTLTFGDSDEAQAMANALVEARLAACAQVWPIASTYRWKGEVQQASEHRLEAKTLAAAWPRLEAFVRERHSYALPEIVAQGTSHANEAYASWVRENVR